MHHASVCCRLDRHYQHGAPEAGRLHRLNADDAEQPEGDQAAAQREPRDTRYT